MAGDLSLGFSVRIACRDAATYTDHGGVSVASLLTTDRRVGYEYSPSAVGGNRWRCCALQEPLSHCFGKEIATLFAEQPENAHGMLQSEMTERFDLRREKIYSLARYLVCTALMRLFVPKNACFDMSAEYLLDSG